MSSKESSLRVADARQRDVGHGKVRIDNDTMQKLGITAGDFVEIHGKKMTVAVAWPAYAEDQGQEIIRMDGLIRRNAGVALNEYVSVRKADVKDAKAIIFAPTDVRLSVDEEFVRLHGYGRRGRYAQIGFSDNGAGIDEETRQRIFEPFFTTKEVGKGTGLGLSSVYGVVKQHDGFINCYSEPGMGTTFKIYLPIIEELMDLPADSVQPVAQGGAETILLAEDDPMVRELVRSVLEQFGYTVVEAVDGEDAVAKFRESRDTIQLAILDVIMPKKNGRQAYEEIQGITPGMRAIFMSGYPAEVFQGKELSEARLNFISKPVSPRELLRKIRDVLEGVE